MSLPTDFSQLQNIILIGFMGCGKSSIGFKLHQDLGYPLLDTDTYIESKEHLSITNIFAEKGEAYFRDCETRVIEEALNSQLHHHIIATGGGLPIREENRALLRQLGFVVWLDASPEAIYERVKRNRKRPLLKTPHPKDTICQLLSQRHPIYESTAHLRINTSNLDFNEIAYGIIESAHVFFSHESPPAHGQ